MAAEGGVIVPSLQCSVSFGELDVAGIEHQSAFTSVLDAHPQHSLLLFSEDLANERVSVVDYLKSKRVASIHIDAIVAALIYNESLETNNEKSIPSYGTSMNGNTSAIRSTPNKGGQKQALGHNTIERDGDRYHNNTTMDSSYLSTTMSHVNTYHVNGDHHDTSVASVQSETITATRENQKHANHHTQHKHKRTYVLVRNTTAKTPGLIRKENEKAELAKYPSDQALRDWKKEKLGSIISVSFADSDSISSNHNSNDDNCYSDYSDGDFRCTAIRNSFHTPGLLMIVCQHSVLFYDYSLHTCYMLHHTTWSSSLMKHITSSIWLMQNALLLGFSDGSMSIYQCNTYTNLGGIEGVPTPESVFTRVGTVNDVHKDAQSNTHEALGGSVEHMAVLCSQVSHGSHSREVTFSFLSVGCEGILLLWQGMICMSYITSIDWSLCITFLNENMPIATLVESKTSSKNSSSIAGQTLTLEELTMRRNQGTEGKVSISYRFPSLSIHSPSARLPSNGSNTGTGIEVYDHNVMIKKLCVNYDSSTHHLSILFSDKALRVWDLSALLERAEGKSRTDHNHQGFDNGENETLREMQTPTKMSRAGEIYTFGGDMSFTSPQLTPASTSCSMTGSHSHDVDPYTNHSHAHNTHTSASHTSEEHIPKRNLKSGSSHVTRAGAFQSRGTLHARAVERNGDITRVVMAMKYKVSAEECKAVQGYSCASMISNEINGNGNCTGSDNRLPLSEMFPSPSATSTTLLVTTTSNCLHILQGRAYDDAHRGTHLSPRLHTIGIIDIEKYLTHYIYASSVACMEREKELGGQKRIHCDAYIKDVLEEAQHCIDNEEKYNTDGNGDIANTTNKDWSKAESALWGELGHVLTTRVKQQLSKYHKEGLHVYAIFPLCTTGSGRPGSWAVNTNMGYFIIAIHSLIPNNAVSQVRQSVHCTTKKGKELEVVMRTQEHPCALTVKIYSKDQENESAETVLLLEPWLPATIKRHHPFFPSQTTSTHSDDKWLKYPLGRYLFDHPGRCPDGSISTNNNGNNAEEDTNETPRGYVSYSESDMTGQGYSMMGIEGYTTPVITMAPTGSGMLDGGTHAVLFWPSTLAYIIVKLQISTSLPSPTHMNGDNNVSDISSNAKLSVELIALQSGHAASFAWLSSYQYIVTTPFRLKDCTTVNKGFFNSTLDVRVQCTAPVMVAYQIKGSNNDKEKDVIIGHENIHGAEGGVVEVDLQTELTELRGLSVLLADTIPTSIWNDGDHTSSGKEREGSASTYLAIRPQASEFAQALRSLHRPHTPSESSILLFTNIAGLHALLGRTNVWPAPMASLKNDESKLYRYVYSDGVRSEGSGGSWSKEGILLGMNPTSIIASDNDDYYDGGGGDGDDIVLKVGMGSLLLTVDLSTSPNIHQEKQTEPKAEVPATILHFTTATNTRDYSCLLAQSPPALFSYQQNGQAYLVQNSNDSGSDQHLVEKLERLGVTIDHLPWAFRTI